MPLHPPVSKVENTSAERSSCCGATALVIAACSKKSRADCILDICKRLFSLAGSRFSCYGASFHSRYLGFSR